MKRQNSSQNSELKAHDMHIQDQILVAAVTWNLYGSIPPNSSVEFLLKKIINQSFKSQPDIIFFATQQCERSLTMSFFCEDKAAWENCLSDAAENYILLASQTLQGLHSAILVKKQQQNYFTLEKKEVLRAGTCNILGNKGATSVLINLLGQNFQFLNCHLAPHQNDSERRNEVLLRIIDELVEKDKRTEVILCGDLNYRIDIEKKEYGRSIKDIKNTEDNMNYSKLKNKDQLSNQQSLKTRFLPYYQQAPIHFPPTYKMDVSQNTYNGERIPGWTDRIFSRKGRLNQLFYECQYNIFGSDHRPVVAGFRVAVEEGISIFPDQFVGVRTGSSCSLI